MFYMSKAKKNKKRKNGYLQKFKYNVCCNDYGVSQQLINWCKRKCHGNWGWWFDPHNEYDPMYHNVEAQDAYMSFSHQRDAFRFWFENLRVLEENRKR